MTEAICLSCCSVGGYCLTRQNFAMVLHILCFARDDRIDCLSCLYFACCVFLLVLTVGMCCLFPRDPQNSPCWLYCSCLCSTFCHMNVIDTSTAIMQRVTGHLHTGTAWGRQRLCPEAFVVGGWSLGAMGSVVGSCDCKLD